MAVVQSKEVNRGHQIESPDPVLSFPKPGKICQYTIVKRSIGFIRNKESNKSNAHLFNNFCIYFALS